MSGVAVAERSAGPGGAYGGPDARCEPSHPNDPRTIGRYEVLGRLGAGGMGTVFLARDHAGRRVAVKVIRADLASDPEFRERFADEVAAARRVKPFCTAEVLDADPKAYQPYLVTEYIDGRRLDAVVEEGGPLGMSTLQGVAVGVASALTAIHGAGIVHRDLKPSNVMLSFSGPRVIDFGIARALDALGGRTRTGLVIGSVGWMAPEQMEGAPVGPATDVFAWGLLVGYAATGIHPYGKGTYFEVSEQVLTGRPDLSGVPTELRPMVAAALGRDPRLRPSAEQVLLALLGDAGRVNPRAAATRVLDGTWPGESGAAAVAGFDPTRKGGSTAAPGRWPGAADSAAAAAAAYGAAGGAYVDPTAVEPTVDPARAGAARRSGYSAGQAAVAGDVARRGGGGAVAAPGAGRPRRSGYVRYEEPPRPAAPAPAPAPRPPAQQRPARWDPAADRPPPASYRPAPAPYRPAPPATPVARPAEPAARYERPRRRRRRLRIPFKRTIIFVLMVFLLLSAADRIASAVDHQRQALWDRAVTAVEDQISQWRGQATSQIGDRLGDRTSGSATGAAAAAGGPSRRLPGLNAPR
jgi:predicted Ser/Thr protein kinase